MTRPVRELKGFARVAVPAGGATTARFELHTGQLGFYGRDMTYRVEPGVIEIHLGTTSVDLTHVGDAMLVRERHAGPEPAARKVFSDAAHIGP